MTTHKTQYQHIVSATDKAKMLITARYTNYKDIKRDYVCI